MIDLLPERITRRMVPVDDGSGCILWTGWCNDDGYPYVRWEGRDVGVHRVIMASLGHDIDGKDVDHRCLRRACVNESHLEVVTHAINMDRTRPTACRRAGHDWSDPHNVYIRPNGRRCCAECARQDARKKKRVRS